MCVCLSTPAIPKQANRYEKTTCKHERQSKLGSANSIVFLLEVAVNAIVEESGDLGSDDGAEAEGDVVQTGDAAGFVVFVDPEV